MIQRIQTIYLFLVTVCMVVMMALPVGNFIGADMNVTELTNFSVIGSEGVLNHQPWALLAILLLVAVLSFVTIFLFKKRMLQIRLSLFSIVLLVGYYISLGVFVYLLKGDSSFSLSWTVCLPFASIVFEWLAIRGIGKDEMLVKAYDRLR